MLALMPRAAEVYRDQIDQGSAAIRLPQRRRLLEGEKVAVLCREFDVSRKTGYKIFSRYKDCGLDGLTDRSHRPYRQGSVLRLPIA